jgi:hypothetical protein
LSSRFPQDVLKTFWASWSFPTSTAGPTGSTAASWVFSVTAAASSAVTATSPKCFRAWPIFTPCAWPSRAASSTPPNICENLRPVGFPRFRHHQHARLHRRHHFPGHHHPAAGRNFLRADPQPTTRTWAAPAPTCGPRRTASAQARCEYACYDTQALCYDLTQEYQDELHRPAFPYKFKFKFDGCPNCCVASIARADMSFIGTWKDDIKIDQEAVQAYIGGEFAPNAAPTPAATGVPSTSRKKSSICAPPSACGWKTAKLKIDDQRVHPLHALHQRHAARPENRRRPRLSILVGAKAPSSTAPRWAPCWSLHQGRRALRRDQGSHRAIWDWWMEEGKNRERSAS